MAGINSTSGVNDDQPRKDLETRLPMGERLARRQEHADAADGLPRRLAGRYAPAAEGELTGILFFVSLALSITGITLLTDSLQEGLGWTSLSFAALTALDAVSRFHKRDY